MKVGNSATQWPDAFANTPLQLLDPTLPFRPRQLRPNERSREDLYTFYSPRNRRIVSVIDALNFGLALRLEFDSSIAAYVERPCQLMLSERRRIDLTYWVRPTSGEECFYLTIPASVTRNGRNTPHTPKDQDALTSAARRQGIRLDFVFEAELIAEGERLSTYFRLLPYVQSTRRLGNRGVIADGIRSYLSQIPRATFRQLTHALPSFHSSHVVAMAAAGLHDGTLHLLEDRALSPDSLLQLGGRP